MLVDLSKFGCLDRVLEFLMVMMDFFPDALEGIGNLNFSVGLAFLVFVLSSTGLSGK